MGAREIAPETHREVSGISRMGPSGTADAPRRGGRQPARRAPRPDRRSPGRPAAASGATPLSLVVIRPRLRRAAATPRLHRPPRTAGRWSAQPGSGQRPRRRERGPSAGRSRRRGRASRRSRPGCRTRAGARIAGVRDGSPRPPRPALLVPGAPRPGPHAPAGPVKADRRARPLGRRVHRLPGRAGAGPGGRGARAAGHALPYGGHTSARGIRPRSSGAVRPTAAVSCRGDPDKPQALFRTRLRMTHNGNL